MPIATVNNVDLDHQPSTYNVHHQQQQLPSAPQLQQPPAHLMNWIYLTLADQQQDQQRKMWSTPQNHMAPTQFAYPQAQHLPFNGYSTTNGYTTSCYNPLYSGLSSLANVLNNGHPNINNSINELADQLGDLSLGLLRNQHLKQPPPNYLCHLCFQKGHYIKDCPKARPRGDGLAPYQGKKRCFGEYKCPKCRRKWMSGNSWSNMGQECIKCQINVYPHKQRPLSSPDGLDVSDQSKVHPQNLCEKCRLLGFYCRKVYGAQD